MADVFSPADRSRVMRAVRSKNTSPEMRVRRAAHAMGLRFRLHRKDLPGSPDLVFRKHKLAMFVHGCFWHAHDCPRGRREPKSNADYWKAKRARNQARDDKVRAELQARDWRVAVIWECDTRPPEKLQARLLEIFNEKTDPSAF